MRETNIPGNLNCVYATMLARVNNIQGRILLTLEARVCDENKKN